MRVVSWNLAYMKPAGFKEVENRRRQWEFLGALQPDIAMLQECRPEDLTNLVPFEMVGVNRFASFMPMRSKPSSIPKISRTNLTICLLIPRFMRSFLAARLCGAR